MSLRDCVLNWKIENYSFCPQRSGEYLQSPDFNLPSFLGTLWFLRLYPKGIGENRNSSCFLHRNDTDAGPDTVSADFTIQIRGLNDVIALEMRSSHVFPHGSKSGFETFLAENLNDMNFYVPRDTLTLRCRLIKVTDTSYISSNSFNEVYNSQSLYVRTVIDVEKFTYEWTAKTSNDSAAKMQPFPGSARYVLSEDRSVVNFHFGELKFKRFTGLLKYKVLRLKDSESIQVLKQAGQYLQGSESFRIPSFSLSRELLYSGTLTDDTMRLRCEISISYTEAEKEDQKSVDSDKESELLKKLKMANQNNGNDVLSDIQSMFIHKKMTDIVFLVGNEKYSAHKFVLAARSEVFAAMFGQDMIENQTGEILITDLDSDVFEIFLSYIYGSNICSLDAEIAERLLYVAEKYLITSLKEICSCILMLDITEKSVCKLLILADMTNTRSLKEAALVYFRSHTHDILKRTEWTELRLKHKDLAIEALTEFANVVS